MSAATIVQGMVIAAVVAWAALFAARRFLPVTSRRVQARMLARLDRPSSPNWLRAFARRAQPRSTLGGSCGDGCSACGGCAAAPVKPTAAQPLVFQARPRTLPK